MVFFISGIGKNGGRIISPELLEVMRQNQFTDQRAMDFSDTAVGYGYGLGVRVHINKSKSLLPSPIGEFGWGGAAGANMLIDPVNHISMFYVQHLLASPIKTRTRLVNVIYS